MALNSTELKKIVDLLQAGEIIACPAEGVFGLTCDPRNEQAVHKLLTLKKRSIEKGLILITDNWDTVRPWIENLDEVIWKQLNNERERPTTWVLPASEGVPAWIRGNYNTIAVRLIQHPIAKSICTAFENPLVSTSANLTGEKPCLSYQEVEDQFGKQLAYIVHGATLGLKQASQIVDARTGRVLR